MREKYAQKFINIIREWTRIIIFASGQRKKALQIEGTFTKQAGICRIEIGGFKSLLGNTLHGIAVVGLYAHT